MGKTTTYLLVNTLLSCLLLINLPCFAKVDANNYDAFWLWSGVRSQPILEKATTIYLLRGQIVSNYNKNTYFISQGNSITPLKNQQLWLVYRAHTLNWNDDIFKILDKQLKQWQNSHIKVVGIQIDFDTATSQLSEYIVFLKKIRAWLPNDYQLSITGLLDWGSNSDTITLNQLANSVDEIIFQTYQGKKTIVGYQNYLKNLQAIKVPFKIGIIQKGEWQPLYSFEKNPYFKGYVVFLQNEL